jgi:ribose-phosphate pyrophosphokinase
MPILERTVGTCPVTEAPCEYMKNPGGCLERVKSFSVCEDFALISGDANRRLVDIVRHNLGMDEYPVYSVGHFKDKELKIKFEQSIRGRNVYIIESGQPEPGEVEAEAQLLVNTARKASAKEITVIWTYYPFARQDRKDESRVPISGATFADNLVNSGMDRMVTVDLHAEQMQGALHRVPWDNLYSSSVIMPRLRKFLEEDLGVNIARHVVFVSPDAGGFKRTKYYADTFGAGIAIINKFRDPNIKDKSRSFGIVGNVRGRVAVLVDDITNTFGTLVDGAEKVMGKGARDAIAVVSHAPLVDDAPGKLADSAIRMMFTTDSIDHRDEVRDHSKIQVCSIAPLITSAICRIQSLRSVDELFDKHIEIASPAQLNLLLRQ